MTNKAKLLFDGSSLKWEEGGDVVKEWPAMSGKKDFQSSEYTCVPDAGPIPEGKWHVRQENHQSADFIDHALGFVGMGKWPGGYSSWGDDRIWLEPDKKTNTQGRTNLSIHGGSDPGSRGCIDLAGGMSNFISYFDSHGEDMDLIVKYPDWF